MLPNHSNEQTHAEQLSGFMSLSSGGDTAALRGGEASTGSPLTFLAGGGEMGARMDIGLPEMNSYEVARRLRELPGLERVRLIALTGYGQAEDQARAQAAGFDDHLMKPVESLALQQALAGFVPVKGQ
jgi:CheY-like chemotaxis protein